MHRSCTLLSQISNKPYRRKVLLAFVWVLGTVLGFAFSTHTTAFTASLMRSVSDSRLSIVGLLLVLSFPLLTAFVMLRFSKPLLLLPFAFLKAFCFSCCTFSVVFAFSDAGWLVRWLFLFSDTCLVLVFLWFSFRNIAGKDTLRADFTISLIVSAAIGFVDYFIVSPFALMLFDHL